MSRPDHHRPDGRFRNPWPSAAGDDVLRRSAWRLALQWFLRRHPPDPTPEELIRAATGEWVLAATGGPARTNPDTRAHVPEAAGGRSHTNTTPGDVQVTWIGHATTLIQLPGLNLLIDPVWSERCSPLSFMGPRRFVPPPMPVGALPEIHAVLLSHDHYDHLDRPTVRALHRRFGDDLTWYTPLGYAAWFAKQGVTRVVERDWWEAAPLPGGRFEAVAVPARHWTRRRPLGTNTRLWCGWVVRPAATTRASPSTVRPTEAAGRIPPGPRVYIAGDSGYCPAFAEVGHRLGPFDACLVPIGAYEPRWFMGAAHMNPEEAVQAYLDAGGQGAFIPIHWGTWRLTFEDPLEPPVRLRAAWANAGLPTADLHVLRHGEMRGLPHTW
jgi:N-acyl-phosphatidylethanolamine-hydrolysing phospholipase D